MRGGSRSCATSCFLPQQQAKFHKQTGRHPTPPPEPRALNLFLSPSSPLFTPKLAFSDRQLVSSCWEPLQLPPPHTHPPTHPHPPSPIPPSFLPSLSSCSGSQQQMGKSGIMTRINYLHTSKRCTEEVCVRARGTCTCVGRLTAKMRRQQQQI